MAAEAEDIWAQDIRKNIWT